MLALMLSCAEPSETPELERTGHVKGRVSTEAHGDVWLFLYNPKEGPPGLPVEPQYVTAISADRLKTDDSFVFANVRPNPYRAYALQDTNRNFDGTVDVLSQPTAGDRVTDGIEFNSQPGRGAQLDVPLTRVMHTEPPAFYVAGEDDLDVPLDSHLETLQPLTLVSDALGYFDETRVGFTFGLVDADNDGRPDDADGDGTPDLSLLLLLRWLPLPGQLDPAATVVVPLLFDPTPFLNTLDNRLDTTVTATQLQVVVLPQAVMQSPSADGGVSLSAFGAPPVGEYELVALQGGGQFWRLPNQLGSTVPSQRVRFHVDHSSR